MKRKAYLDWAATTPVYPQVIKAMTPFWRENFGNPSSLHRWGEKARKAVDESREKIAALLDVSPLEIIFTGTTTCADNLALQGIAEAKRYQGKILVSAVEHHAVLDVAKALARKGVKVAFVPVNRWGEVKMEFLEKEITRDTFLVSIMMANNEVGTIQPVNKISELIRRKEKELKTRIYFHTDAAAAVGWVEISPPKTGVDLLSLGAHKFGGPKGVGLLYKRQDVVLSPITFGGHHEFGLWPGTEPVPLIVGMAKALELTLREKEETKKRVEKLRDQLIEGMLALKGVTLTGHPQKRLPDIASFIVDGVEGEAMLLSLSDYGIAASSGSACSSGELKPSHVLLAMGIPPEKAHGSIRFSLGRETTEEEIRYVLRVFPKIIERLRGFRRGIKNV